MEPLGVSRRYVKMLFSYLFEKGHRNGARQSEMSSGRRYGVGASSNLLKLESLFNALGLQMMAEIEEQCCAVGDCIKFLRHRMPCHVVSGGG